MNHIMDASFVLPTPDMVAFNNSRTLLRQQALSLGDIYLTRLQEKIQSLLGELDRVDTQGLATLTLTPVGLETESLSGLIKNINVLREAPSQASANAIKELVAELVNNTQQQVSHVADHLGALDDAMTNFRGITLDDAGPVIDKLEAEMAPVKARLEEESKPFADLQQQQAALNKLIAEVESISLLERLKPLIESLDNLLEIDPKDPLPGSVKAGLEGIKNQLNLGIEFIKYDNLISLRQTLQEREDTIQGRLRELQDQIAEQEDKVEQLKMFQGLGPHRLVYLREVGTIVSAIKDFPRQNQLDPDGDVVVQVSRFIENAQAMTAYLHGLRREWQS